MPDEKLPAEPIIRRSVLGRMFERAGDAFSVLFGLRRATSGPRLSTGYRIGSPADDVLAKDALVGLSSAYEFYKNQTYLETDRISVYNDMDEMMMHILCASALHAYVEDATQPDGKREEAMWVESPNPRVTAELTRLWENLEIEDRIYGDYHTFGKYGDLFCLNQYEKDIGITDLTPLEPRITHRHENFQRQLLGFSVGEGPISPNNAELPPFKPWDVIHWRMRMRRPLDIYGCPFFYDVRLIVRTLKLMEEQMAVYRMSMHPDRLLFKVFVGSASPDEAFRIIRKWRQAMERILSFNNSTEKFTSEYAPYAVDSSIYWPMWTGDDKTGVEKFPGSQNAGELFDISHVRDLLFAGLRVPKAYMGFEDSQGYRSEDTLSQQSVKFARGVKRFRHFALQGYVRTARIHLELRGISSKDPQNQFSLKMSPVSYLDEAHKAELIAKRMETVRYMLEMGDMMAEKLGLNKTVWASYVLSEYGGLEPDLVNKLLTPPGAEGEKGADITYAPGGTGMVFEKLTMEQRKAIDERVRENGRIKELLEAAVPVEDLTKEQVEKSGADKVGLSLKDILSETSAERMKRAEMAAGMSTDAVAKYETARKDKHKADLKILREGKWPARQ